MSDPLLDRRISYSELFVIREFRWLFILRIMNMMGVVVSALALASVVFEVTGSALWTACAMFGGPFAQLLCSPFVISLNDRLRPGSALFISGLTAALCDLAQLIHGIPVGARFALLCIAYAVVAATGGAGQSLLVRVCGSERYGLAQSTLNIAVGATQVVGNAVGGLLLLHLRPVQLFMWSSVASLGSAVTALVVFANVSAGGLSRGTGSGSIFSRTRDVNWVLLREKSTRLLFLLICLPGGCIVACEALFIPYARGSGAFLFAAASIGMLCGDVVVGRFFTSYQRDRGSVWLFLTLSVPYLVLFGSPPAWVTTVAAVVASFGYSYMLPLQEAVARSVRNEMIGQAFSLLGTGIMVSQAVFSLVGGELADVTGPGVAIGCMSGASLSIGGCLFLLLRRQSSFSDSVGQ